MRRKDTEGLEARETSDQVKGRKKLSFPGSSSSPDHAVVQILGVPGTWTASEDKALVEFIMFSSKGDSWPGTIN